MKKSIFDLPRAILVAAALTLLVPGAWCFAQDNEKVSVATLKDTAAVQKTASGNITTVTADAMLVKAAGDRLPQVYVLNGHTGYVDDQGAPAQKAKARPGQAVIITYVLQGDTRVAIEVVIRNAP